MDSDLSAYVESLGSDTVYEYSEPKRDLLEWFPNPLPKSHAQHSYASVVKITCPEFTSLCPKTGQPDFATIKIDYTPDERCVESKSLKLYLGSFRMHGEFHEACIARIAADLINLLDPYALNITGEFTPRGGIPFWPQVNYRKLDHGER